MSRSVVVSTATRGSSRRQARPLRSYVRLLGICPSLSLLFAQNPCQNSHAQSRRSSADRIHVVCDRETPSVSTVRENVPPCALAHSYRVIAQALDFAGQAVCDVPLPAVCRISSNTRACGSTPYKISSSAAASALAIIAQSRRWMMNANPVLVHELRRRCRFCGRPRSLPSFVVAAAGDGGFILEGDGQDSRGMVGFIGAAGAVTHVSRRSAVNRDGGCRQARFSRVRLSEKKDASDKTEGSAVMPLALPVSTTWEIDFYSRPVVGADGKKLWELIVTDKNGNFEHVESVPNSLVNSKELKRRLQAVIDESPTKPKVLRFFRAQMQNMIKIALAGIDDIVVTPSRRTYSLFQAIEYREKNVYPEMLGYQATSIDPFAAIGTSDFNISEKLPDSLRGEKYAFVTLQAGQIRELSTEQIGFGEMCPVPEEDDDELAVPGICIYSKRAAALAGWLTGSELAGLFISTKRREVLLQCGLNTNYLFARITEQQRADAKAFEQQLSESGGLHFLAVQTTPEDDEVAGFWLLRTFS